MVGDGHYSSALVDTCCSEVRTGENYSVGLAEEHEISVIVGIVATDEWVP